MHWCPFLPSKMTKNSIAIAFFAKSLFYLSGSLTFLLRNLFYYLGIYWRPSPLVKLSLLTLSRLISFCDLITLPQLDFKMANVKPEAPETIDVKAHIALAPVERPSLATPSPAELPQQ